MKQNNSTWKDFYRNCYSHYWKDYSQALAQQPYHIRYQDACLEPIRHFPGNRLLESGVGRGDLLCRWTEKNISLYGCDISAGNIQYCQQRFLQLQKEAFLSHADAERLPFANESFDIVYSLSVLWYVPNFEEAIAELFRVTKPGGMILFDMLNTWHVTSLANHFWRKLCRVAGRELGHTSLSSPNQLMQIVEQHTDEYHLYGNYLYLPAGLPVFKEAGNLCRYFPKLAYAMNEGFSRRFSHKLLAVARKK